MFFIFCILLIEVVVVIVDTTKMVSTDESAESRKAEIDAVADAILDENMEAFLELAK